MLKYKSRILSSFASLLLFGGLAWLFAGIFLPQHLLWLLLCIAIGAAVIFSTGLNSGKLKQTTAFLWLIAATVFVLFFQKKVTDGLAGILSGIIDIYKRAYPKNYDVFTTGNPNNIIYFLIPASVLVALGCQWAVRRQVFSLCAALALLLIGMSVAFLPILSSAQIAATVILCLFLGTLIISHCKSAKETSTGRAFFGLWLRTAAIMILTVSLLFGIFGAERPAFVVKSEAQLIKSADALRFGSTNGTGLTEGDLSCVGPRQNNDAPMMKVTMSVPSSGYFRGFVGEVYDKSQWKSLSNNALYKNADNFAFLHQNGFYSPTQLSSAEIAAYGENQGKPNIIKIENIGLPSRYYYVPYGLIKQSDLLDPKAIKDSVVSTAGLNGVRTYTLKEDNSLVLNYQKITSSLLKSSNNNTVKEYLSHEAVYNRFVYENYTALPSDIDAYLSDKLGSYAKQDSQQHFDYTSAKQNILYYLTNTVTYDETVPRTDYGVDFVLNFLDGTKRGYDIHFASAAVMMFRYYGIPARFAEGYIVTAEDKKNAKSGEAVTLDSSHAHAWAEYYQDGIGWLPFEATPTYLSIMEQPDKYHDISGLIGQLPENENIESPQPDEPNKDDQPTLLSFWLKNRLTIGLILAVSAAVILLLLFSLWLIRERRKTAARKALFFSADRRLAVCTLFGYIIDILSANNIPLNQRPAKEYADFLDDDLKEPYCAVVDIWQEAVFSKNEITREQLNCVVSLKDELWERLWKKAGLFKKIQIKFMYFL